MVRSAAHHFDQAAKLNRILRRGFDGHGSWGSVSNAPTLPSTRVVTSNRKRKKQALAEGLTTKELELAELLEEILDAFRWMQILGYSNQYLLKKRIGLNPAEQKRVLEAATRAVDRDAKLHEWHERLARVKGEAEEDRIEDCVRSLSFCDEILVVDSGSTDRTRELAEAAGAQVVINAPFPGHREQKQWAVDRAAHDWVLCLDADERIMPDLRAAIETAADAGLSGAGYEMPRRNHYLGRIVRRGLFWPDRKIRLFDRRLAHWGGRNPHDRVETSDGSEPVRLDGGIEHLSYRDFRHHLRTIDSFTRISAEALWREGRRGGILDLALRPPAVFLKSLILKVGFVDGWRGFVIATMAGYYDWLKYWRLRRLKARPPE
eukprot:jgi/Undpi1/11755/HiC_scaffold_37.g14050.m1